MAKQNYQIRSKNNKKSIFSRRRSGHPTVRTPKTLVVTPLSTSLDSDQIEDANITLSEDYSTVVAGENYAQPETETVYGESYSDSYDIADETEETDQVEETDYIEDTDEVEDVEEEFDDGENEELDEEVDGEEVEDEQYDNFYLGDQLPEQPDEIEDEVEVEEETDEVEEEVEEPNFEETEKVLDGSAEDNFLIDDSQDTVYLNEEGETDLPSANDYISYAQPNYDEETDQVEETDEVDEAQDEDYEQLEQENEQEESEQLDNFYLGDQLPEQTDEVEEVEETDESDEVEEVADEVTEVEEELQETEQPEVEELDQVEELEESDQADEVEEVEEELQVETQPQAQTQIERATEITAVDGMQIERTNTVTEQTTQTDGTSERVRTVETVTTKTPVYDEDFVKRMIAEALLKRDEEEKLRQKEQEMALKAQEEAQRQLEEDMQKKLQEDMQKQLEEERAKLAQEYEKRALEEQLRKEQEIQRKAEEERLKAEQEMALKAQREEQDKRAQEEAENFKRQQEEFFKRQQEQDERNRQIALEQERMNKEFEARQQEFIRILQLKQEEFAKREQELQAKIEQFEEKRIQAELEEKRIQAELEEKRIQAELEEKRIQAELDEKRRQDELEEKRRQAELEEQRRQAELEEQRRQAELEEQRRQAELEEQRRQAELEEQRRQAELEEQCRQAEYEEQMRQAQKAQEYERSQFYYEEDTDYSAQDMNQEINVAKIKVIGVGGAGSNAVNRMIELGVDTAEFVAVNTDKQALMLSLCDEKNKIQIGANRTKGLGAGAEPTIGEESAEESKKSLEDAVKGVDLLFIAAGMGGGTGTGAAPIVAKMAKEAGCVTVAVVTRPFHFEGKKRELNAKKGISNLAKYVDTIIIIPNDRLLEALPSETPFADALKYADDTLRQAICGIADLIATPSLINLDFADVRTILKNQGLAHMGVGKAKGENRVIEAVRQAVSSPLLETTIEGAHGIIINVTGGKDLSMQQVTEAAARVQEVIDPTANIIFGMNTNPDLQEEIIITIIATGFDKKVNEEQTSTQRQIDIPLTSRVERNDIKVEIPQNRPQQTYAVKEEPKQGYGYEREYNREVEENPYNQGYNQEPTYQNQGYQGYQNQGYQNQGYRYQDQNYQDQNYQDRGYPQNNYENPEESNVPKKKAPSFVQRLFGGKK